MDLNLQYLELNSYDITDYTKFTDNFISVDTETTGLSNNDDIVEIAAIKYINGQMVDKFTRLIKPSVRMSEGARRVNHISDSMLMNARPMKLIIADLHRFLCGGNLPLVFHNAAFDLKFILRDMYLNNLKLINPIICTMHFAESLHDIFFDNLKLQTLAKHFKTPKQPVHRAEGDAITTALVYLKLLEARKNEKKGVSGINLVNVIFKNELERDCTIHASDSLNIIFGNDNVTFVKNKSHVNVYANNIFIQSIHVTKNTTRVNFKDEDISFDSLDSFKLVMLKIEEKLKNELNEPLVIPSPVSEFKEPLAKHDPKVNIMPSKNKSSVLILCIIGILGFCGLHRFYVGKVGTGVLWLLTFGLFGIGQLVDLIIIISGEFRDSNGLIISEN